MKQFLHFLNSKIKSEAFFKSFAFIVSLCSLAVDFTANAQVSGTVFKDFNSNGSRELSRPNETGIAGATVKAYVGSSSVLVTKTTDASGNYAFSAGEIPAGSKVRLEFLPNIPNFNAGMSGPVSQSSIQFITAPATNVSMGFLASRDYCQPDPPYFALPCYVTGDPLITTGDVTKDAAEGDALVAFDYLATGVASASNFPPIHLGLAKDVGSIWGVVYHSRTKHLITAAIVKRHAGLGTLGTGGLYKTDVATGVSSPYIDLKTIGIDTGPDPHTGLPADKNLPSADPQTFAKVGKVGIGGDDLSSDGLFYYLTNLYDKKLYRVNVGKELHTPLASDVRAFTIPNSGCSNNDFIPWGVVCDGPSVYVGVTCTAETSQLKTDLKAVVYRLDTASGVFSQVLSFPLDFKRGAVDNTGACANVNTWLPWSNNFPAPCVSNFVMYPQPILSDIAFDNSTGHMSIGFTDRFGHQSGVDMPDLAGNGSYQAFTGGDLIRAYRNADGTFSLENNGKAGPLTGSGVGNGQGLGGGEFFSNDEWKFFGKTAHEEVLNGGLLVLPGYEEVLSSSYDPIDEVFLSSGWQVYNVNTGALMREFAVFGETDVNKPFVRNGTFGKAAALGSGRAICDAAPIEVGNRVWIDKNLDGIQSPDEMGIDGIEVVICDAVTGAVVGKDTTSNGGKYYFNNDNVLTSATNKGLEYDKAYIIKIAKSQPALKTYPYVTTANLGASDLIDSDGEEDATNMFVKFSTGSLGVINHSFDFGVTECLKLDSLVVSACDLWSNTYHAEAFVAYNNTPKKNLHLVLTKPDGTVLKDTIFVPANTGNHQMIEFTNLISNGLAGMKLSVNVVGADIKCKFDTTYNAPEQCTVPIAGEFLDPMGFVYCEETGEIIKGATIEVFGEKPAIILEDGSDGIYRFMVDPTAFGVYTMKVNLPVGYEMSTKCLVSNDTLQLSGNPNPYEIGSPANDSLTYVKSNACTTFYYKFNIQFGDPMLHFNNIPLKGCCIKPNAGADTTVCMASQTTIKLAATEYYQFWKPVAGNPAAALVDSLSGAVSGMTVPGTYKFQLISGVATSVCRDTVSVTFVDKPSFRASTTPPTCLNGTLTANGKITLTTFGALDHVAYSLGTTYTGAITTYATAAAIPVGGVIASNLPSPATATQAYTIRVFNATGCYKDTTVNLAKASPNCDLKGSLGDFVWKDTDNDGVQDTGEAGVAGVQVEIYKNGTLFGKDTTDAAGKYLFTNLLAGTYKIKVLIASFPAGCLLSTKPNIGDDAKDSDVNATTGESGDYIIDPTDPTKKDILTVDAALVSIKGKLGDYVFIDYDINGIQNTTDKPVKGVIVELYNDLSGTVLARDTTDITGHYLFENLNPGRYRVRFVPSSLPADLTFTLPLAGTDSTKDSNADTLTGFSKYVNILKAVDARDSINLTLDAGIRLTTWDPSGYIYCEEDGKLLKGGKISVTGPPGVIITIINDGSKGYYKFASDKGGLFNISYSHPKGYKLSLNHLPRPPEVAGTAAALDGSPLDKDGAVNGKIRIGSYPNADTTALLNYTASYNPYYLASSVFVGEPWVHENNLPISCTVGSLGDFVWKDTNNNGIQDVAEVGVKGVQIELYKNGTLFSKDTTDAAGKYLFETLYAGTYKIKVLSASLPAGCMLSSKSNIGDDTKDSDVNATTGESGNYAIDPADPTKKDILTVDAALYTPKGSIGDFIWKDSDNDGIQDIGESGVSGVIVELLKNGSPVKKDTTDVNGKYLFNNLDAGIYRVKILTGSLPAGCVISSKKDSPSDDGLDSDFDPVTGITGDYEIDFFNPVKKDVLNVDGALYSPKGSFGDFIWKDTNNDGIQDAGEPGVAGVQVELYKNGTLLAKDTTDALGKYMFTNLDGGSYKIKVLSATFPAACLISTKSNIGNDTKDSDVSPTTGESGDYAIDPTDPTKKDILSVDAALYTPQDCVKPNAGNNQSICLLAVTTVNLVDASSTQKWTAQAGNPAGTINASTGVVDGLTKAGVYQFILTNTTTEGKTCSDTVEIKVANKPTFSAAATSTTCLNGNMQSNGKITLTGFGATDHFVYTPGSSYTGVVATYAAAAAIPSTGIIANNLVNPTAATQAYTIRVFNAAGCTKDTTIVLLQGVGDCCTNPPVAGKDIMLCGDQSTTVDLLDANEAERWDIVAGNPTSAIIDAKTGVVSNLTMNGTYQFQLVLSPTCKDTIKVIVGSKPMFTANTTKVTCNEGNASNNGMITLSNFTAGNRYAFVKGNVYNGTVSTYAAATAIPASGIIATTLSNPATATEAYTIRVFNATGCYTDVTTQLLKEAGCCVPICIPFTIIRKK